MGSSPGATCARGLCPQWPGLMRLRRRNTRTNKQTNSHAPVRSNWPSLWLSLVMARSPSYTWGQESGEGGDQHG